MNKLNRTKKRGEMKMKGKMKGKVKRKTYKSYKGGGECKGPMCTICQECLTVRDDPTYAKYFDMLDGEIKVVVQQRMLDAGLNQSILDNPDALIEGERPVYKHSCGSLFHFDCIKTWCLIKKNADKCLCPNCREPIDFNTLDLDTDEALELCEFRRSNIIDAFIVLRGRYNSLVNDWNITTRVNDDLRSRNRELRSFYTTLKTENESLKNRCRVLQGV
jgi:hypothetical protein